MVRMQAWWLSHDDELLGSIGSMMKGSGLEEALEPVYGPNAVAHVISGKAVSRALRGHFLVEAALVNKLMLAVLPCHEEQVDHSLVECTEENENDHTNGTSGENLYSQAFLHSSAGKVQKIHDLHEGIQDNSVPVSDIADSKELIKLEECFVNYKALLAERSRCG
jgi:hypothetical protein